MDVDVTESDDENDSLVLLHHSHTDSDTDTDTDTDTDEEIEEVEESRSNACGKNDSSKRDRQWSCGAAASVVEEMALGWRSLSSLLRVSLNS